MMIAAESDHQQYPTSDQAGQTFPQIEPVCEMEKVNQVNGTQQCLD